MKQTITYIIVAIAIIAACIGLFACFGIAVFLLPLLAGAFK